MQQALIGILLVLGLASYMLYTENQTLTNNNVKLEGALADQTAAIETLRESFERQGSVWEVPTWSLKNQKIWGLSAMITVNFLNVCFDANIEILVG